MTRIIPICLALIMLITMVTPSAIVFADEEEGNLLTTEELAFTAELESRISTAKQLLDGWKGVIQQVEEDHKIILSLANPITQTVITDTLGFPGCSIGSVPSTPKEWVVFSSAWNDGICGNLNTLMKWGMFSLEVEDIWVDLMLNDPVKFEEKVNGWLETMKLHINEAERTIIFVESNLPTFIEGLVEERGQKAPIEVTQEEQEQIEDWWNKLAEAAGVTEEGTTGSGSSPLVKKPEEVKEEPEEVKEEPKQPVVKERDADESSDDWCFIATAAYGTSTAQEIDILRGFRDEFLRDSWLGNQFITNYYKYSPPIAKFISERELLRTLVREVIIDPIVVTVEHTAKLWGN